MFNFPGCREIEKCEEIKVDPLSEDPTRFARLLPLKNETNHRRLRVTMKPTPLDTKKPEGHTRFVCISDTHNYHDEVTEHLPPDGDVLLHCGDFSDGGKLDEVKDFNKWLGKLPKCYKHKIVIAGNHELSFDPKLLDNVRKCVKEERPVRFKFLAKIDKKYTNNWAKVLSNCTYLQDAEVTVNGIRIYGTPWNPYFGGWAFNEDRGQPLLDHWNKIPGDGINILMTHTPPAGHLDEVSDYGTKAGCVELFNTVQLRVKPKYHIFGHIHEGYGYTCDGYHHFMNCSLVNEHYNPIHKPMIIDFPTPEGAKMGISEIKQY